jgi:predicted NUDIX family NTP pyrophosphohydrolase
MGKRGPTPKFEDELRSVRVSVYLSEPELAELDRRRSGIRRADWLRKAGLGQLPRTVPEINRDAWAELARVAANLNQHQRAINEGRAVPGSVDLSDLRASVDALRNELLGVRGESED